MSTACPHMLAQAELPAASKRLEISLVKLFSHDLFDPREQGPEYLTQVLPCEVYETRPVPRDLDNTFPVEMVAPKIEASLAFPMRVLCSPSAANSRLTSLTLCETYRPCRRGRGCSTGYERDVTATLHALSIRCLVLVALLVTWITGPWGCSLIPRRARG